MTKRTFITLLVILGIALTLVYGRPLERINAPASQLEALEKQGLKLADRPAAYFTFGDLGHLSFHTLQTHAIPWKAAMAALCLHHAETRSGDIDAATLRELLQGFGFIWPREILNWPGLNGAHQWHKPLGMVSAELGFPPELLAVETANMGCASCHAGRVYDAQGLPLDRVWLGLPNTSLNIDGYVNAVYAATRYALPRKQRWLEAIETLFPEVSAAELRAFRYLIYAIAESRVQELSSLDRALPFDNGGPGITNGVAALKLQLGLLNAYEPTAEYGYTSIPDLGDTGFKTALLYDGAYGPPGKPRFAAVKRSRLSAKSDLAKITAFFTVPTQGGTFQSAMAATPTVTEMFDFIGAYTPPPYPGAIDRQKARQGYEIYQRECAHCHGEYSDRLDRNPLSLEMFPNRLVTLEDIGTDPHRALAIEAALVERIRESPIAQQVDAAQTRGYVAPGLSALWATAPYLHNGSVPTLWHLLHPEQRPRVFEVGGHRLDYEKIGIAGDLNAEGVYRYPQGYMPWSGSRYYDTAEPGKSNRGHEKEFEGLDKQEKELLMEFLKLL